MRELPHSFIFDHGEGHSSWWADLPWEHLILIPQSQKLFPSGAHLLDSGSCSSLEAGRGKVGFRPAALPSSHLQQRATFRRKFSFQEALFGM